MQKRREENTALAMGITCHRLKQYLGAHYAERGQVDAIVFTGRIGENDAELRAQTCAGFERLGIELEQGLNAVRTEMKRPILGGADAVKVFVTPTNEEREISRQACATLSQYARYLRHRLRGRDLEPGSAIALFRRRTACRRVGI